MLGQQPLFRPLSSPEPPGAAYTRDDWESVAARQLKGADLQTLASRTLDGVVVEPLASIVDPPSIRAFRSIGDRWRIMQRVDQVATSIAHDQALEDLWGGADGLVLAFRSSASARGSGIGESVRTLSQILADVDMRMISVRAESGEPGSCVEVVAGTLDALYDDPAGADIEFGLDPLGSAFWTSTAPHDLDTVAALGGSHAAALATRGVQTRAFLADGRPYHEAGASEAQELALVLATALSYLRALERTGVKLGVGRHRIAFLLTADADQLLTTAKFRALRGVWQRIERASGLEPCPVRLHAETSWRLLSRLDPWTNLLRTTIAAFSAGIGGADTITVLPYTAAENESDGSARRLARNVQHVLLGEARLGHCEDPCAGAASFERLTRDLSATAWRILQDLEAAGGLEPATASGFVAEMIDAISRKRDDQLRRGRAAMVGVNMFPDVKEVGKRAAAACASDALPSMIDLGRPARPFEELRAASASARASGRPWQLLLVEVGPEASARARRDWVRSTLQIIGIEAFVTTIEAAGDATFSRADWLGVCLIGSDDAYRAEGNAEPGGAEPIAATFAARLREAGWPRIALAGKPGDAEAAYRGAGIGIFLHLGCDLVLLAQSLGAVP